MKLQALLACIWWSLSSDTVAAVHLLWAFAPDWANGCVTSLANHYRNISCGEKYFLRRKIYFLRKNIFLAEKYISCGKKYITCGEKYISCGEKYTSCGEKYFLRKKIFLAEKNISCGKNTFLAEKNLFLAEKNLFLAEKNSFLAEKNIFLAEKNISCGKKNISCAKIFLYHVTNKLPYFGDLWGGDSKDERWLYIQRNPQKTRDKVDMPNVRWPWRDITT